MANDAGSKIPNFSHYRSKQGTNTNLLFQYFMVGTMGAITAAGAKATVQGMFWGSVWSLISGSGRGVNDGKGQREVKYRAGWSIEMFG
jgi:hypothetical protein